MLFKNRRISGQKLADRLDRYSGKQDVVVLGLARGGIPVANEVAAKLQAPLDVFLVQKLGVPGREELAFGALASGDVRVMNQEIVSNLNVSSDQMKHIIQQESEELERRENAYRGDRERNELEGKIVILVDDGLATGASMRAAVKAVRTHQPKKIVVAVPVAAPETCGEIDKLVDETICFHTPSPFRGVGAWYRDFPQVDDQEVQQILAQAEERVISREQV
jgi:putative phosphoribosyl transferase